MVRRDNFHLLSVVLLDDGPRGTLHSLGSHTSLNKAKSVAVIWLKACDPKTRGRRIRTSEESATQKKKQEKQRANEENKKRGRRRRRESKRRREEDKKKKKTKKNNEETKKTRRGYTSRALN